ncbi:MAG: DUF4328 domain-containing protein [Alphaproteobacteria bacterium]|nr:DUF4328 domain-containing protein [Alphaproteobacteria bacterium]
MSAQIQAPRAAAMAAGIAIILHTADGVVLSLLMFLSALAPDNEALLVLQALPAIGLILTLVLAWVTFLVWFNRTTVAVRALVGDQDEALTDLPTPGGSVGWWFVPFINLIRPRDMTRALWRWSAPDPRDRPDAEPSFINAWWGFWIGSNLVSNFTTRISLKMDDQMVVAIMDGFVQILTVAAAVFAIRVLRQLTERVEQAAAQAN